MRCLPVSGRWSPFAMYRPGCTVYLEQMRTTIRLLASVHEDDLAPQTQEELLQAFREWNRR